jgi:hypothetical protein
MPKTYAQFRNAFTIGKWYDGKICPVVYDPTTLEPVPTAYLIKCDNGYLRKVEGDCFITLEEWRETKLNELGL